MCAGRVAMSTASIISGICEMVGRPETHPVKKIIGFTEEMIEAVENWRAKQRPVPNLSEAIRRLVEFGSAEQEIVARPLSMTPRQGTLDRSPTRSRALSAAL